MSDEPNDGPGPDGNHRVTGECFACMVGVATGPESHGEGCPRGRPTSPPPAKDERLMCDCLHWWDSHDGGGCRTPGCGCPIVVSSASRRPAEAEAEDGAAGSITVDHEADVACIYLADVGPGGVARCERVGEHVLVNYGHAGEVVSVEVLTLRPFQTPEVERVRAELDRVLALCDEADAPPEHLNRGVIGTDEIRKALAVPAAAGPAPARGETREPSSDLMERCALAMHRALHSGMTAGVTAWNAVGTRDRYLTAVRAVASALGVPLADPTESEEVRGE